jgi:hypothetical protein
MTTRADVVAWLRRNPRDVVKVVEESRVLTPWDQPQERHGHGAQRSVWWERLTGTSTVVADVPHVADGWHVYIAGERLPGLWTDEALAKADADAWLIAQGFVLMFADGRVERAARDVPARKPGWSAWGQPRAVR